MFPEGQIDNVFIYFEYLEAVHFMDETNDISFELYAV